MMDHEPDMEERARAAVWEDDDGNLFPMPRDVTPEINVFLAAIICTLLTGIGVYVFLVWAI